MDREKLAATLERTLWEVDSVPENWWPQREGMRLSVSPVRSNRNGQFRGLRVSWVRRGRGRGLVSLP